MLSWTGAWERGIGGMWWGLRDCALWMCREACEKGFSEVLVEGGKG